MEIRLSPEDNQQIQNGIREKYSKVAENPDGLFNYPTGRAGLEALGYNQEVLDSLPDVVSASYCGVGNPFSLGEINEGEAVLDIGCGVGVDLIFAAKMVGPGGKVVGVDMVSEMLARGTNNIKAIGLENVTLIENLVENLDFPDESFDVVISNGVFNLIPDKEGTAAAAFRLLKPGGRFMIADQVLVGMLQKDLKSRIDSWFQWEGGAVPGEDFLAILHKVGFENAELVSETGFNSSLKTKGVLIRAKKPTLDQKETSPMQLKVVGNEKPIAKRRSGEVRIEDLLKRARNLGAEKAKIIDTDTIVVKKWVRWKCLYGCPLYNKDAYHPPLSPDTEETREVLKEYNRAILLNGSEGKKLTEIAVKLEGEAYHMGYYKAFAMTALTMGGNPASDAGATWPSGETGAPCEPQNADHAGLRIRPMMEACGIDVFKTARRNGFEIDTQKETYGKWNYFALVLLE